MSEKSTIVSSGLAGAAALAAASGAYAAIVPANSLPGITLTAPGTFAVTPWDIDGDGFDDMAMVVADQSGPFTGTTWSSQIAMYGNSAVAYYPLIPYAYNLAAGVDVGSQPFELGFGGAGQILLGSDYQGSLYGAFTSASFGETGYIGIRFANVSGDHFAWALVRSTLGVSLEVLGAYYNDAPLGAISTGQVPAPGTLAALAFGAAAFSRRSRKNAA